MKKILLTLAVLCITQVQAQDTIRIKHTSYTTVYSKSLHYPVLVEWWETKAKSQCQHQLARKDNFQPDPQLPNDTNLKKDYIGSGADRGHMCPARVNLCLGPQVQDQCFYFSNMAAQYHSLNAGDWKSLETFTFDSSIKLDSIYVRAGCVGSAKKIGTTTVPTKCWKVIYIKKTHQLKGYIFDNNTSKPDGFENNEVPVDAVEKLTGFKFDQYGTKNSK